LTKKKIATPRRGEVWLVDFGQAGKTRPALVVSVAFGDSDRALITVVPHTTSLRGSPFEIAARAPFLKPGAFLVQGRHHVSGRACAAPPRIVAVGRFREGLSRAAAMARPFSGTLSDGNPWRRSLVFGFSRRRRGWIFGAQTHSGCGLKSLDPSDVCPGAQ
jgi:hypothetical protein